MKRLPRYSSPMLPGAEFEADVVLVAPREVEVTRAQRTYREKNFTSFTELLNMGAFQAEHIKRINEALGLEALAASLGAAGMRVAIINCNVAPHTPAEIVRKVVASRARVVGISLIYRPQVGFALELMELLRAVPGIRVAAGGALASYMPRELLGRLQRLDAVVFGEAEETFRDYCQAVLDGAETIALRGVAQRRGDTVVINPAGEPLELAKVPRPARQTLQYLRAQGWPTRIASIFTSRGCLAKCTFCTGKDAYNVGRKITYRYRDPGQVVDEIQALHEEFGVRYVYFNDDNFLGYGAKSRARVEAICAALLERRLPVQFATECRVDGIDPDILRLLKEAGMRQVLLGIESGSEAVLLRWRKGTTVAQNHRGVEMCRETGVTLEPGFILFDAETSQAELRENLGFLRAARFDRVPVPTYLINRLSVYPGTEVEREWTEKGILAPSPIAAERTACPSDRTWMASWKEGRIAREGPIAGGVEFVNDPEAIIRYFQRLEYTCADPRSEIAWRGLRGAVEPLEVFLESRLPGLMAVLSECRGPQLPDHLRAAVRELVHRAARWRQGVGGLVLAMLEKVASSYDLPDPIRQLRFLRRELTKARRQLELKELGMSCESFEQRVLEIRRSINPMQVSIIIPSAGKWSRLRRTLDGLRRQHIPEGLAWEVVLVLDGAKPPVGAALGEGLPLRVVRHSTAQGRGAARNAGLRAARGETAILLDDDVVVGPSFVVTHLDAQSIRPALCHGPILELPALAPFEDLDALTPAPNLVSPSAENRLREVARRVLASLEDVAACGESFGQPSRYEADGAAALRESRREFTWLAFAGANLSAPRKWFLASPFDERLGTSWGVEDLALALRWSREGRPLVGAGPDALGLHLSHHRPDWRPQLEQSARILDFLPPEAAQAVIAYLSGDEEVEMLEAAFEEACSAERGEPTAAV